jgi:hypothetical protein
MNIRDDSEGILKQQQRLDLTTCWGFKDLLRLLLTDRLVLEIRESFSLVERVRTGMIKRNRWFLMIVLKKLDSSSQFSVSE